MTDFDIPVESLTSTALPPTELFSAWVVADQQATDAALAARAFDSEGKWAIGTAVWALAHQMEDTADELGRLVRMQNRI